MDQTQRSRGAYAVPIVLGLCCGLCTFVVTHAGSADFSDPALYVLCALYALLFSCAFGLLARRFEQMDWREREPRAALLGALGQRLRMRWGARDVVIAAAVLFVLWLPYLIALHPGIIWMDTSAQVADVYTLTDTLSAHHPVFTTLLFGAAAKAGTLLFHSKLAGLYCLIVIQALLGAGALAAQTCYLHRLGLPWTWRLGVLAFCALFPAFGWFLSSLVKDTFATPFFVVFCIAFEEVVRTRGKALSSPRWVVALAVSAVVAILCKKAYLYLVVAALVAAVPLVFRNTRRLVVPLACCVVLAAGCSSVFNRAYGAISGVTITRSGTQEVLSIPLQQVANVIRNDAGQLTDEERRIVNDAYPMGIQGISEAYNWTASDGVKQYEQPEHANYPAFLGVWLRLGLSRPDLYLEALGGLVGDWFSFGSGQAMAPLFNSEWTNVVYQDLVDHDLQLLAGGSMESFKNALVSTPVVGVLFKKCVWATVVPAFCTFMVLRQRKERLVGLLRLLPLLLSCGVLLIGPTSISFEGARYVFPMLCVAPLYVWIAIHHAREGQVAS